MEQPTKDLPTLPVTTATAAADPKSDFVLVFKSIPSNGTFKDAQAKAHEALTDEYDRLLGVLKAAGLEATGRSGGKGTNTILVFVRATAARVAAEVHRERCAVLPATPCTQLTRPHELQTL